VWCLAELDKAKDEAKATEQDVGDLSAEIDQQRDTIAALASEIEALKKALTLMVNSVYIDDDSRKTLKSLESTAFVQEDEEPAGNDAMAAQVAQNEKNLAAFEGLKGKAEESLQRMRDEETKAQSEHNIQVMSLKQAIALAENNVDDAKKKKTLGFLKRRRKLRRKKKIVKHPRLRMRSLWKQQNKSAPPLQRPGLLGRRRPLLKWLRLRRRRKFWLRELQS